MLVARLLALAFFRGGAGVLRGTTASSAIYLIDGGTNTISRIELDGKSSQQLVTGDAGAEFRSIAVDGVAGKMYWTERGADRIQRANMDGTAMETFVSTPAPEGIAIDTTVGRGGTVFWTSVSGSVQRAAISTGNIFDVLPPGRYRREGIAASGGQLMLTAAASYYGAIERVNADGGKKVVIAASDNYDIPEMDRPLGVTVHPGLGDVFFSDVVMDSIFRVSADGSSVQVIVHEGLHSPIGLAVDEEAGALYWVDRGNTTGHDPHDAIWMSNLDGSQSRIVWQEGLAEPRSLLIWR